jgi:hypothetical protein
MAYAQFEACSKFTQHETRITLPAGRSYPTSFDKPVFGVKFHPEACSFFERSAVGFFKTDKISAEFSNTLKCYETIF